MIEYFVELCRMLSRNVLVSENSRICRFESLPPRAAASTPTTLLAASVYTGVLKSTSIGSPLVRLMVSG
jgi:hypothetical protein